MRQQPFSVVIFALFAAAAGCKTSGGEGNLASNEAGVGTGSGSGALLDTLLERYWANEEVPSIINYAPHKCEKAPTFLYRVDEKTLRGQDSFLECLKVHPEGCGFLAVHKCPGGTDVNGSAMKGYVLKGSASASAAGDVGLTIWELGPISMKKELPVASAEPASNVSGQAALQAVIEKHLKDEEVVGALAGTKCDKSPVFQLVVGGNLEDQSRFEACIGKVTSGGCNYIATHKCTDTVINGKEMTAVQFDGSAHNDGKTVGTGYITSIHWVSKK